MNVTIGRTLPSTRLRAGLQHASLAAGLALVLSAAVVIGRSTDNSTGRQTDPGIAGRAAVERHAITEEVTFYIVGSTEEAAALSSAVNEGLGGPARVIVAASPQEDAIVSLMAAENAHGVATAARILDLRDR